MNWMDARLSSVVEVRLIPIVMSELHSAFLVMFRHRRGSQRSVLMKSPGYLQIHLQYNSVDTSVAPTVMLSQTGNRVDDRCIFLTNLDPVEI